MALLSTMTCIELAALLAEAETAYHDLVLGRKARVVVDSNGERVEFVAASKGNLYSYVLSLRDTYASRCGGDSCPAPVRGPLGFTF